MPTAEHRRLADSLARRADWKNWGPYVSDRAWGTVREDYSDDGRVWASFPFDQAHRRTFRWNEDGIGGFCNRMQNVCLTVALWNTHDPILKERFFGLSGDEGNHGEDVKEYYFYLDGVPSHAYMKMLYRYPQTAYPYGELRAESKRRSRRDPEVELIDVAGKSFEERRYFDVAIEYAKAEEEDIYCRITATNKSEESAPLHIVPQILFRNTWSWGVGRPVPRLAAGKDLADACHLRLDDRHLGTWHWYASLADGAVPQLLVTENNSAPDLVRAGSSDVGNAFAKDGIGRAIMYDEASAVNPRQTGTKAGANAATVVPPGESAVVHVRFCRREVREPFADVDDVFAQRIRETNEFYDELHPTTLSEDERLVQRQALAGLLWSKQFYHYSVALWLDGDPGMKRLPEWRHRGRNAAWRHLYNLDVVSMPDKWEYPWYAAWDMAFHMLPTGMVDPEWAKRQLVLMLREWYMHPNGQLPAYEWSFGDVNPPVHAWAALRVFERDPTGPDLDFLERVFQKLLLNFTWWVNQKDENGNNVFEGGFLGLDNIGVLNRSMPFPPGVLLEQADGTAWMAMYCLNMLKMALRIAEHRPTYEDVATKFFEHFVYIASAMNAPSEGEGLWNDEDGFYYDVMHLPDASRKVMRIRSFVGLISLFASDVISSDSLKQLPKFRRRMAWFERYRPELARGANIQRNENGDILLSLVSRDRIGRLLERMLDEDQFLSEFGLRSLSREHLAHPFSVDIDGSVRSVHYEPAESTSGLFGGNSNWRGPIWMPLNYLMVDTLRNYASFYGRGLTAQFPSREGPRLTLTQIADEISRRLTRIFLRRTAYDSSGETGRPLYGGVDLFQNSPDWTDHVLFYEYFHGDNGAGIGAGHQTGWTSLVACLLQELASSAPS